MIYYQRFLRAAACAQALRGYAASVGEITKYIANNGAWATPDEIEQMLKTLVERGELVHSFGGRYVVHTHHRERALKGVIPQREDRDHIDSHRTHLKATQADADRVAAEYHARRAARAKEGEGTEENPFISRSAGQRVVRAPAKRQSAKKATKKGRRR